MLRGGLGFGMGSTPNDFLEFLFAQFSRANELLRFSESRAPGGRGPALPEHFCIPPSNQWLSSLSFVHKRSCCFIESILATCTRAVPLICRGPRVHPT